MSNAVPGARFPPIELVKFPKPAWDSAPFGSSARKEMAEISDWHGA